MTISGNFDATNFFVNKKKIKFLSEELNKNLYES